MVVQGYMVPAETRATLGLNPSAPYTLHPDGRLTEWQAIADPNLTS